MFFVIVCNWSFFFIVTVLLPVCQCCELPVVYICFFVILRTKPMWPCASCSTTCSAWWRRSPLTRWVWTRLGVPSRCSWCQTLTIFSCLWSAFEELDSLFFFFCRPLLHCYHLPFVLLIYFVVFTAVVFCLLPPLPPPQLLLSSNGAVTSQESILW